MAEYEHFKLFKHNFLAMKDTRHITKPTKDVKHFR